MINHKKKMNNLKVIRFLLNPQSNHIIVSKDMEVLLATDEKCNINCSDHQADQQSK